MIGGRSMKNSDFYNAVKNRTQLQIFYNKKVRVIEPQVYGILKTNKEAIDAIENGEYKTFHQDKITSYKLTDMEFTSTKSTTTQKTSRVRWLKIYIHI